MYDKTIKASESNVTVQIVRHLKIKALFNQSNRLRVT